MIINDKKLLMIYFCSYYVRIIKQININNVFIFYGYEDLLENVI
jgi:hypothetical protein